MWVMMIPGVMYADPLFLSFRSLWIQKLPVPEALKYE
jgi:hypothetical protein